MRYVLLYETNPAMLPKAKELFPAHAAVWKAYHAAGTLTHVGPFENPADGALSIFTTREAAEAFAKEDPFVQQGLVARWRILGWNEVLGGK